jgi:isoleucyl-tRNA synthetase
MPDYNNTINLPKTDFPMRGNLPKREPDMLEKWEKNRLYYKMVERNLGKTPYILHDGPPYANGEIHLGTALNKCLKDFIIKHKNMSGFYAPYVPGWDTHGLPIELKALKAIGIENGSVPPEQLRKHCKDFAMTHVKNQMAQFKRLGCLGDYDDPYLTLKPEYEARQVEVFGAMAKKGYMYKGLKPVYWCPDCNTALAEAEIEYSNDPCHSIFVKFNVIDDNGIFSQYADIKDIYFVIWTTTTWTIPGNLAVCLGPEYEYTLVKTNGEYYVMAAELVSSVMKSVGIEEYETVGSFKGKDLEYIKTKHPLYDRTSPVIVGDHVTLESGTGCVHTAPGYGVEDFEVCKNYDEIGILVCVDAKGRQTAEAGEFEGLDTDEANKAIAKKLEEVHALLGMEKIVHQYPHCWRCNSPIIYRATEQWFCSVNGFKDEAVNAIETVKWIPEWGEERIKGMVRDRSDWCISRQRTWGVPIPIIYCADCKKPIVNDETIKAISGLFRAEGSDAWWLKDTSEFIPESVKCECGCGKFTKEYDIMDVWFDSGVSHTSVLDEYEQLKSAPADLYLEGADQYRGWFQSSLLTSVVYNGFAPYKAVCTHGWVVDGQGKTMHKSLGNGIAPNEITDKYGADILRLWVASSDYHSDIRISKDILSQLSDMYKKIRNTSRLFLGNLSSGEGFNPDTDMVSYDKLTEIDKWALMKLDNLIDKVNEGYNSFDFHIVLHSIHNFYVTDMSNFYIDITKDRLYCESEKSDERRSAQTVMYIILSAVTRLIAPIISYTAEEIWGFMPHIASDNKESVFLNDMPEKSGLEFSDEFISKWDMIISAREEANKELEIKRNEKLIGKSLEANIIIHCKNDDTFSKFSAVAADLASALIVSDVSIVKDENAENDTVFEVIKAEGEKCERCWAYSKTVGSDSNHPTLCCRCAKVVK